MTIGQLSKETGVSERTLRFYEKRGLLQPGGRTASGYRYYGPLEIQRLQQIRSLQSCGLSLASIGALLESGFWDSRSILKAHLEKLDEQIETLQKLRGRLARLEAAMASGCAPADHDLLRTIEEMSMLEKHVRPEEMEKVQDRHRALGEQRNEEARREWAQIVEGLSRQLSRGKAGADPASEALAARGRKLLDEFTDQSAATQASLLAAGPAFFQHLGLKVSPELSDYIVSAIRASNVSPPE